MPRFASEEKPGERGKIDAQPNKTGIDCQSPFGLLELWKYILMIIFYLYLFFYWLKIVIKSSSFFFYQLYYATSTSTGMSCKRSCLARDDKAWNIYGLTKANKQINQD